MIHVLDFDSNIIDFISKDDNSVIRAEYTRDSDSELLDITMLSQRAEHFKKRNRVIIQDKNGIYREFIIIRVEDEGQYVTIECNASYLHDIDSAKPILAGKYEKMTVNDKLSEVLRDTGWIVGDCDFAGIRTMSWTSPQTPYEMIKLIETNHSLKASYEIVISGNEVTERKINMREPVSLFKGKEILYGKDLIEMKRTIDFSEVKTALLALGPENDKGQRISTVVVDDEAQEQFNLPQRYIWGLYEPETEDDNMTLQRLTTLATTELNKRKSASISYEITVIDLEREYPHEVVRYGDLVRIKNSDFTPSLYAESEVIGFTHDLISDDCTYTFGRIVEYKEDDLLKYFRSKLDYFNQKLNDNITNVNTIVQDTLDTELQHYEKKIIKSDTPPENLVNDVFWLDTSNPNVPILKRYWEGQWIKASVDNAEDIGGITREKALFSELSNTFINLTIQHSKLLNEMHEVMNSEYLVDEDIKTLLNSNLDKTIAVFDSIKANLDSMTLDTATIGKLIDTQTLFLKYREQLQALYKVIEQAKLSIDARFKLLQSQYTDEKFNSAMDTVAKTLPNGKWNPDTKTLTSDIPNQEKLDSIVSDLKLFVNNQDNALETKIGESVDAKIVDTKNEFTRQFTKVNTKVDGIQIGGTNLIYNKALATNGTTVVGDTKSLTIGVWAYKLLDNKWVHEKLKPNTTHTISYDFTLLYKPTTKHVSSILGRAYLYSPTDASKRTIMADVNQSKYPTMKVGDKTHISSTFTTPHDLGDLQVIFYNTYHQDENGVRDYAKVLFENIMLVEGNKSTDWAPAPEDIDESINDVKAKVETVEGGLTATNKKFETIYSKTETEQLLNSNLQPIKTDVNSTKSSITQLDKEVKSKVSQSTYTTDQENVVQRLNSADTERQQLSNQIADRVTLTEYKLDKTTNEQQLETLKTEIIQDGTQIAQEVSQQIYNTSSKTLNRVLSQYINDTTTGHRFTYDENGNISNFTVGSSGIKLNARVIDMNDGDVTIKNGVTTIKDAYIDKLFSKQATINYLDAIGITARTLQARDKQASVNIENGSITMNRDNGARMDIGLDGIQSFNNSGSLRFSLTPTLVTTSAVGTSVSNVYLGAAPTGEARVVDMNGIPGDGAIGSYYYRPLRTLAIKFPLKANGYIGIDGNELRIMSDGLNDGGYKSVRADKGYFATVDANNEISGTHFYIRPRPGGELRTTYNNGGETSYANFRSNGIYAPFIDYNGHINGGHLYLRPSSGNEVRFTMTGTTDKWANISFKEWNAMSHEKFKHDIEEWNYNVLDIYKEELQLHKYKVNHEDDKLIHHGVVLRENSKDDKFPIEWRNGDGYNGSEVLWWNTKAIQELAFENDELKSRLKILEDKLDESTTT